MTNLRAPLVGLSWLPKFAADIAALFRQKLSAPFWLWSAATADLPTEASMGANEGALAYDDTLNTLTFFNGAAWLAAWGIGASAAAARTNMGLVAGGAGDIWVEKAGDTMTGLLTISMAGDEKAKLMGSASPRIAGYDAAGTTAQGYLQWSSTFAILNSLGPIVFNVNGTNTSAATANGLNVESGKAYYANGTKVVGEQGAAVADATDAATAITQLNALLARARAHGLIAT
jgi:hypothetical protein